MPAMSAPSEACPAQSSAKEPVRSRPETTVGAVTRAESASLPARFAAAIPPTPTRPNKPITALE